MQVYRHIMATAVRSCSFFIQLSRTHVPNCGTFIWNQIIGCDRHGLFQNTTATARPVDTGQVWLRLLLQRFTGGSYTQQTFLCLASIKVLSIVIDVPNITFTILIYINIANSKSCPSQNNPKQNRSYRTTSCHICRSQVIAISCQILPCHSCLIFSYPRTLMLSGLGSFLSYLVHALKYTDEGANCLQTSFLSVLPCFVFRVCLFSDKYTTRLYFIVPKTVSDVSDCVFAWNLAVFALMALCLLSFVSQLWCHRSQHPALLCPPFWTFVKPSLFASLRLSRSILLVIFVYHFGFILSSAWLPLVLNYLLLVPLLLLASRGPAPMILVLIDLSSQFSHGCRFPHCCSALGELGSCAFVAPNYFHCFLIFTCLLVSLSCMAIMSHVCAFCLGSALFLLLHLSPTSLVFFICLPILECLPWLPSFVSQYCWLCLPLSAFVSLSPFMCPVVSFCFLSCVS